MGAWCLHNSAAKQSLHLHTRDSHCTKVLRAPGNCTRPPCKEESSDEISVAGWGGEDGHSFDLLFVLVQNKGILAMLDEECLRPGNVTEKTFLQKLNQTFSSHQHYESKETQSAKFITDVTLPANCFRVQHYAGKVSTWFLVISSSVGALPDTKCFHGKLLI